MKNKDFQTELENKYIDDIKKNKYGVTAYEKVWGKKKEEALFQAGKMELADWLKKEISKFKYYSYDINELSAWDKVVDLINEGVRNGSK